MRKICIICSRIEDKDNEYTQNMKLKRSKTFFVNKFRKSARKESEAILRAGNNNEVVEDGYVLKNMQVWALGVTLVRYACFSVEKPDAPFVPKHFANFNACPALL